MVSRHVAASRRHPPEHMKLQFLGVVVAFLPEASFAMCTRQPFPASVSTSLCFLAWSSIQSPQLRMWPGCCMRLILFSTCLPLCIGLPWAMAVWVCRDA